MVDDVGLTNNEKSTLKHYITSEVRETNDDSMLYFFQSQQMNNLSCKLLGALSKDTKIMS